MRRAFAHFWGPQTRNLVTKTQSFYSGVFCPKLKIFTPGTLAHFWGPQTQNLGAKTQNFYSGVFCPKLFLHLKSFLVGRLFHDNNEVKEAVTTCFASQAASFYDEGIQKLVQCYDKCLNNDGNYVEK
jgi:hypothetical protein